MGVGDARGLAWEGGWIVGLDLLRGSYDAKAGLDIMYYHGAFV